MAVTVYCYKCGLTEKALFLIYEQIEVCHLYNSTSWFVFKGVLCDIQLVVDLRLGHSLYFVQQSTCIPVEQFNGYRKVITGELQ